MKRSAFTGVAFNPDFSTHQFREPFANGQAQSGAAIMSRGGRVHLLKGFEKTILLGEGNANASVPNAKVQQPLFGMTEKLRVVFTPRIQIDRKSTRLNSS